MRQTVAAIDFGTSKIVCVIAQKRAGAAYHVLGSGTVPYAGYSDGRWNDIKKLEDATYAAIREAELSAKRKVRQIYVGVPGDFTRAVCGRAKVDVMSKDRRVSKQDVLKLMRRAEQPLRTQHYKILHRRPVYFTPVSYTHLARPQRGRPDSL